MTGISIDLFSVILLTILSFICGYSSGHKVGRNEAFGMMTKLIESTKNAFNEMVEKKKNETRNSMSGLLDFLKTVKESGEEKKEDEHE